MAEYTLDDITSAAEQKYGDLKLTGLCTLQNALKLPKARRRALKALQEQATVLQSDDLDSDDETVAATAQEKVDAILEDGEDREEALMRTLRGMIEVVADSKGGAANLLNQVGENDTVLLELIERYGQVSQPGEASPSES